MTLIYGITNPPCPVAPLGKVLYYLNITDLVSLTFNQFMAYVPLTLDYSVLYIGNVTLLIPRC